MNDADAGEVTEPADTSSTEPDATASDATASDATESVSSASVFEARLARLLDALLWVGNQDVAHALRTLAPAEVMLQPLPVRTALQALRKKRDPANFLGQSQYRISLPLVAEAVADPCQEAVISALGDAADDPDRAQLLAAIGEIRDQFPVSTIALMLAYVSVTDMAAADICDEILESEEIFAIPASATPGDARSRS
jgi:hypothetical protein